MGCLPILQFNVIEVTDLFYIQQTASTIKNYVPISCLIQQMFDIPICDNNSNLIHACYVVYQYINNYFN